MSLGVGGAWECVCVCVHSCVWVCSIDLLWQFPSSATDRLCVNDLSLSLFLTHTHTHTHTDTHAHTKRRFPMERNTKEGGVRE